MTNPRPWICLAALVLARAAMAYDFQAIGSVAPFLIEAFGIGFAVIGTLVGLFMLPGVVLALPAGAISRRVSNKRLGLAGLFAMAIGSGVIGLTEDLFFASVGRLVSGSGAVVLNVVLSKMVVDWFENPNERVLAMSFQVAGWPLGIGLGLIIQSRVAESSGWTDAVLTGPAFAAAIVIMMILVYRDPPRQSEQDPPAGRLITRRELYLVALIGIVWAFFNTGYALIFSFTPAYLTGLGAAASTAGQITSLATWTVIVSVPLGGYIVSRTGGTAYWMAGSFIGMGLSAAALPFVPAFLAILIFGIAAGPSAGAIVAEAGRVLSTQARGIGMGVFLTWYYASMAALPFITGLIRDLSGNPNSIFFTAAVLMLLTTIIQVIFSVASRGIGLGISR